MEPQKTPSGQEPDDTLAKLNLTSEPQGTQAAQEASTAPLPDPVSSEAVPAAPTAGAMFEPQTPAESATPATPFAPSQDSPLPVTPDVTPGPMPLAAPAPKHRKKSMIIGLIVAAVVLLLSGGAAAAYYYMLNQPENVLKRSLANMLDESKVKTMQYSGSIDVEDDSIDMSLSGTYEGEIDNETGAFDLSGKMDVFVTNMTFESRSVDGKSVFLKVGGLDGLAEILFAAGGYAESDPMTGTYAQIIDSVNDQWLEINESMIEQLTGESSLEAGELTDADRKKLMDAYQANSFIVVKEALADEVIKGQNSHHYKLGVDKAKLKSFAAAVKAANISVLKITSDHLKTFNESVDDAEFDKVAVEVWIAKSGKMISQLALTAKEDKTTFKFVFTIDSYNKPVSVEKPEGAKSLLDVMGDFMGDLTNLTSDPESLLPSLDSQSGISL